MRNIYILFFSLMIYVSSINVCNAQVPGYMGKRAMLTFGEHIHLDSDLDFENTNYASKSIIGLSHEISYGYIKWKKTAIGAEAAYAMIPYTYHGYGYRYSDTLLDANLQIINLGFFITFYGVNKGPCAPVGSFIKVKVFDQVLSSKWQNTDNIKSSNYRSTDHIATIGFAYGSSRVISDKIYLSLSAEANLSIGSLLSKYYNDRLVGMAFGHNVVQVKLEIGGFLF